MIFLRFLSQCVALVVAPVFLAGMLFAWVFSRGGFLAGAGGMVAGLSAFAAHRTRWRTLALRSSIVAFAGGCLHAGEYYLQSHFPGNYYAWFITLPFLAAMATLWITLLRTRVVTPIPPPPTR